MGLRELRIAINGLAAKSEGALTYMLNLLPEFATLGSQCEFVIYLNTQGASAIQRRLSGRIAAGFQIRVIPGVESAVRRILWEQVNLPRLISENRIGVLFSSGPPPPLRCPCPAVVVVHNMEPYCRHVWSLVPLRERMRYRYLRWSTEWSLHRADCVILVAEATRSLLLAYHKLCPKHTVVIHHGRDSSFRPIPKAEAMALARESLGLVDPFILYVSKTRPYKNHIELVEAFALLRGRWNRKEHLVIAGEKQEPYFSKVMQCVDSLGMSHYVRFLDDVPYELLPALYNACEVFAYPSTCEACPNIVIEALACGLAMAVSDTPVIREFGADAVMYFDAFDPSSIADALNRLLANPELRSDFGARALQRAQDFSWRRTAERTLEVIREAAGEEQPGLRTQA